LVATGAYDLQVPFPGWDLPGVMTAGGAQSLLKGHGVLAGRRVAVAGTGPFLLSVAAGLAAHGATVVGVYEASAPTRWLKELRAVSRAGGKLVEGASYAGQLIRRRIPYRAGWTVVRADGDRALADVTLAPVDRSGAAVMDRARTVDVDLLAVGWGFVPQIDLAVGLGCDTVADPQGIAVLRVDAAGRTSVPGVFAAGEVCGVGGAGLAVVEGELTGIAVARSVVPTRDPGSPPAGPPGDTARVATLLRRRRALSDFAAALHRAHPVPATWLRTLTDDTVVCRCEEVSAGAIRRVVEQDGVTDGRTAKLLVRPGMGWCQGRMCGFATERLVHRAAGRADAPETLVPERPIVVPIPLGLLGDGVRSSDSSV
jgi:thioredoxin reductase